MKFKVSYYDYDSDKFVTKDCDRVNFSNNGEFSFYPVDNPCTIYKSIRIDHPIVSISQKADRVVISVVGYQNTKHGTYEKTTTRIVNERD